MNVSRHHARLIKIEGQYYIEDLNSYNGVKVNGVKIQGKQPVNPGDLITIGDFQLTLQIEAPKVVEVPKPPDYARLVMISPPEPGREFPITGEIITLGRTDENIIIINHPSVSRQHAEIHIKEGKYTIKDLDSANGVRVNGEEYKTKELKFGDVIELGVVKFKFIGPGEIYHFDLDATIQVDAQSVEEYLRKEGINFKPFVILIIVAIVVAGSLYYFLVFAPKNKTPSETQKQLSTPIMNPQATINPEELLSKAKDAINQEKWSEAISYINQILANSPEHTEAQQLLTLANRELEVQPLYERTKSLVKIGDIEGGYQLCKRIPKTSRYYSMPPCNEMEDLYKDYLWNQLNNNLNDREKVKDITAKLETLSLNKSERDKLNELLKQKNEVEGGLLLAMKVKEIQEKNRGGERDDTMGNKRNKTKGKRNNKEDNKEPPKVMVDVNEVYKQAKQYYLKNDFLGCIKKLHEAPLNSQIVALLASCYQQSNQNEKACKLLNTAKKQYPGDNSIIRLIIQYNCRR